MPHEVRATLAARFLRTTASFPRTRQLVSAAEPINRSGNRRERIRFGGGVPNAERWACSGSEFQTATPYQRPCLNGHEVAESDFLRCAVAGQNQDPICCRHHPPGAESAIG